MTETLALVPDYDGIVIYTDGSSSGSGPGFTGGGVHGYTYKEENSKRGLGLGKWKAGTHGYFDITPTKGVEDAPDESVTVQQYFDAVMSTYFGTNNTAELKAGILGLELGARAAQQGCKRVVIRPDSEYVIKGITQYMKNWERNNWIKADGNQVKNVDLWIRAAAAKKALDDSGVPWELKWVKGHSGDPGNDAADKNASIGRVLNKASGASAKADAVNYNASETAQGYWKVNVDAKVTLLQRSVIIFDSNQKMAADNSLYHVFSNGMGDGTNDLSMFGMPDESACYGIIKLNEPSEYINALVNHQHVSVPGELKDLMQGSIYAGLHSRIAFNPDTLSLYQRQGTNVFIPRGNAGELSVMFSEGLVELLYPPKMALDGIGYLGVVEDIFEQYLDDKLENHVLYKTLDVTEHVYDIEKTKKSTTYKLKEQLNSSSGKLDLLKHYPALKSPTGLNSFILSFGSDMPRTEIVSAAAKHKPKAVVIYWEDSGSQKRAFVLETDEGIGIWHNPWRSVF